MAVMPNVTVRGQMGPSGRGDVDLYRVPAVAGQRLSVEVDSVRIADVHYGGPEYDLAVRILDEAGRVLASNDDNALHLQDPVVAVKLPRDGFAFVEVRRSLFVPNNKDYSVHIGTNRRPLVAFPPGGPAGTALSFQLCGDLLGEFDETLAIPSSGGMFEYFGDAPSPVTLRSSPCPNVLEVVADPITRVETLPAALNGRIDPRDDSDAFQVSVKQGEGYRVRVFAASLASPIDPVLRIRPLDSAGVSGPVEVEQDDCQLHERDIFGTGFRSGGGLKDILDPSVIWEPKSDGEYLIELADNSGSSGPTAVYRIEVEPASDAVHTLLTSTAFDWEECMRTTSLAVPQGNRWTVNFNLPQGQGSTYRGELELIAHAPPARHVVDGRPMPAKVLGSIDPVPTGGDPRTALAQWLTSPDNELFSRNLANRIWAQLLGRGVIEPVDDVRASNPPVNGPLLDALSKRLVAVKFDLRSLVRDICNSRVYQLSAKPNASNVRDTRQFSHAHLRRLRADVLMDSVVTATGVPRRFGGFPEGTKAIEYYPRESGDTEGPHFGDSFFATFGRSSRATVCACETKKEPTLSQTLHLAVGDTVRDRLGANGALQKLIEKSATPEDVIEELYIRTLSRRPTSEEKSEMRALIGEAVKDQSAYEDILWSLLNSTEFAFNH